jgi:hypothetical protein
VVAPGAAGGTGDVETSALLGWLMAVSVAVAISVAIIAIVSIIAVAVAIAVVSVAVRAFVVAVEKSRDPSDGSSHA